MAAGSTPAAESRASTSALLDSMRSTTAALRAIHDSWSGVEPGSSTGPVAGGGGTPGLTSSPGACLNWQNADASDVTTVDCAAPHLFESVGPVAAPQPPGVAFPADDVWQKLVNDQCTPLARSYLHGKLDPDGRYHPGALKPTRSAWDDGDRTVRCGLQAPGRTGARKSISNPAATVVTPRLLQAKANALSASAAMNPP